MYFMYLCTVLISVLIKQNFVLKMQSKSNKFIS